MTWRRAAVAVAVLVALPLLYVPVHCALIEGGNEVVVLRTQDADGAWHESRLWIVDEGGYAWLHGDRASRWMQNLEARPVVELVRAGETARYRATQEPGPHPRIHEKLRAKYGLADRWVRVVGADKATAAPVKLERLPPT
jgi:hypothetical protein